MKKFILIFLTAFGVQTMLIASPEIIAHRGASHFAPENTLASFKLACMTRQQKELPVWIY